MQIGKAIWKLQLSAVCAVVLVCSLGASAHGRQNSSGDTSAKTAEKSTHTTSAHTTATHNSTSSSGTSKTGSTTHTSSHRRSSRKRSARVRGQQKIDSERAQAIQEALIREHYLTGEATGTWNQASEEAMRRYQADNGWQSKTVPDSRALIKLGLGPSKDHLLNPESAMTTAPDAPKADPHTTPSHTVPNTTDPPPQSAPSSTPDATANHDTSSPQ